MKHFNFTYLFCFMSLLLFQGNAFAQEGLLNDDFSTGNSYNWKPNTAGATGAVVNGQYVVTMAGPNTSGRYRGDFMKQGGVTFHAGDYPIVAVKMNKPPRSNCFFDTSLGAYNNTNNNQTVIQTPTGNIYYWDLSKGKLGTTTLPLDQPTVLSLFQFKVADVVLTQEELAANDISYEVDWVKTFSSVEALRAAAGVVAPPVYEFTGQFSHPGLLHNTTDLARMKNMVDNKFGRAYKSYELLLLSDKSSATYTMKGPFENLSRQNGTVKTGVESDFMAAYYNALMWNITGNEAHALKSLEIIDAYSTTMKRIVDGDAELNGLYGFMLANAAELMRYTYTGWSQDKSQQTESMLRSVFYPVLQNFKPCSHGNWDIISMKAMMAIAIFSNDKTMYNKVINYFYHGEGNGSIDHYVVSEAGQLQESNRDQPHTMLALGSLAEMAEIGLKQGIDLYEASNNAIMRGYEYTAKYNLGNDVPYQTSYDYCEKNFPDYNPEAISSVGRGQFRAVFEIAYNHYVFRKSKEMPFTLEVLGKIGPEGAPFGADNPGYGSLFFYLNPEAEYECPTCEEPQNPNEGLLDDNFTTGTDGWKAVTAGSTAVSENGQLKVAIVTPVGGKGRGDMQKNGTTLHPGNYPILAIKMKKPQVVNMTLDTNLGAYGGGANKWTGKIGDDIYYYDLTKPFGGDKYLPTTIATTLQTFQFKVADITSGETNYTVDWVKTVKSLNDLLAFDPNTGLLNDNFTSSTDGWSPATSGATAVAENGQLKVTLAQASGKGRGDIKRNAGATLYPGNYPIIAIKLKNPAVVNITLDTNLGSFGNGSNRHTGKVGDNIYYYDMSKTGFGAGGTKLTDPTALTLFQFKVADITSGEANYLVDWVKTVKTVEELQNFIAPRYQYITFPALAEMKVGDEPFASATASSGLAVTYSSSNTGVATIVDGKINLVGAGTTTITVTQVGNNTTFYAAEAVSRTLTVVKREQTITFAALTDRSLGEADFDAGATASSGLAVSYTSSDATVATIVNGKVHLVGVGTTTITAAQEGNNAYHAATAVSQTLNVIDTTPPTVPIGLTSTKRKGRSVELIWQAATDNVGVTGYEVYLDGTLVATVTETSYITEYPIGNNMYVFTVKAIDAAGNRSAASEGDIVANGKAYASAAADGDVVLVYPNPSKGDFQVRVSTEETGTVSIYIYDSYGNLVTSTSDVKSTPVYEKAFRLLLVSKGVYSVKTVIGNTVITKSLLLE
ncbi:DUF4979 domain-containing protein [Botryobacter ruber]|uniref:DUF4979 domain-containing protein n=1 Tax=Botryobacter ruber TaxID=2171629 RepID=UPI000F651514|nr:DUF4979 domain-containing protein [Botryobacter ruber]